MALSAFLTDDDLSSLTLNSPTQYRKCGRCVFQRSLASIRGDQVGEKCMGSVTDQQGRECAVRGGREQRQAASRLFPSIIVNGPTLSCPQNIGLSFRARQRDRVTAAVTQASRRTFRAVCISPRLNQIAPVFQKMKLLIVDRRWFRTQT